MPDVAVHAAFGKEVLSALPEEVRAVIVPGPYRFALFGPDLWFMHKPWRRREGRGRQMHTTRPGAFLTALLQRTARSACRPEMFSYLSGFFCHYALDSITHPYIIHVTTAEYCFPRSHMSLEHALDALEMQKDGHWGEAHPVTEHYFPSLRLPPCMEGDVDAVFEEVYGWPRCWKGLNRSCALYRKCYRILEHPRGAAARIARLTGIDALRSLVYSESHFLALDAENAEHRTWKHPFDPSLTFTDSFPELRAKALERAVSLITAAYRLLWKNEGSEEELSALIGNFSYLSGLPEGDPRNFAVPSLLPSGSGKKERA